MSRFFNTAGPVVPADHYVVPLEKRLDVDELLMLIQQKKYFVLHAPRQTGKTSCLLALMRKLNAEGKYTCLYINIEAAQAVRENVEQALQIIVGELARREQNTLKTSFIADHRKQVVKKDPFSALQAILSLWASHHEKPLVLL